MQKVSTLEIKSESRPIAEFKLLLVGDAGVGKSSFVKRHVSGHFESKYIATRDVDVHPLDISTNKGNFRLNIWDTAGL